MNILVTGVNGQLGSELKALSDHSAHNFTLLDRSMLDLSQPKFVCHVLEKCTFDVLINCAAYTAVDKAESEEELAFSINAESVKEMALYCKQNDKTLIQISTDFIFDGTHHTLIAEDAKANPISVYGASKNKGEEYITDILEAHYIVRTSWVYSKYGNNFVKTMKRLMGELPALKIVADQIGTPTNAKDLAVVILEIINHKDFKKAYGTYHYSNEGVASWYDFAEAIKRFEEFKIPLGPQKTVDYPTPAKRPAFSVMDKSKIKSTFGIEIPHWQESLKACLKEM